MQQKNFFRRECTIPISWDLCLWQIERHLEVKSEKDKVKKVQIGLMDV